MLSHPVETECPAGLAELECNFTAVTPELLGRRRNALLVEPALMHGISLAYQDVGRDLVLGAAELPESREQDQVVERLFGQRQTERPGFRAIFRSSHSNASRF